MNTTEPLEPANEPSTAVPTSDPPPLADGWSRRSFLRGAAVAGGGLVAAGIAACTPGGAATWTFGPQMTRPSGGREPERGGGRPTAIRGLARWTTRVRAFRRRPGLRVGRRHSFGARVGVGPRLRIGPALRLDRAHSGRLDRARHRRAQRHPPLHRQSRAGAQGHLRRRGVREAGRHPRRSRRLPRAEPEAGVRPGAAAGPQRRADASHAADGRRRQGVQPHDRRDRPADRRARSRRSPRSATTGTGPGRRSV